MVGSYYGAAAMDSIGHLGLTLTLGTLTTFTSTLLVLARQLAGFAVVASPSAALVLY